MSEARRIAIMLSALLVLFAVALVVSVGGLDSRTAALEARLNATPQNGETFIYRCGTPVNSGAMTYVEVCLWPPEEGNR